MPNELENIKEELTSYGYSEEEIAAIIAEINEDDCDPQADGQPWMPTDLTGVDWVLRKLSDIEHKKQRLIEPFKMEIGRLQEKIEDLMDEAEKIEIAQNRLADWFRGRYQVAISDVVNEELKSGKSKSVKLPNGAVGYRKSPQFLEVSDSVQAVAYLEDCFDDDKLTKSVNKVVVKKFLKDNPGYAARFADNGMVLSGGEDELYIKVK